MSHSTRTKWKQKYLALKKGSTVVSMGTVSLISVKEFITDFAFSKLKRYGYSTMIALFIGPVIQLISLPFYFMGGAQKIGILTLLLYDVGAKITAGDMSIIN
jgi:hypothetical protein